MSQSSGLGLITHVMERSGYEPLISIKFEFTNIKITVSELKDKYFGRIIIPIDLLDGDGKKSTQPLLKHIHSCLMDCDKRVLVKKMFEQKAQKAIEYEEYENCISLKLKKLSCAKQELEWLELEWLKLSLVYKGIKQLKDK